MLPYLVTCDTNPSGKYWDALAQEKLFRMGTFYISLRNAFEDLAFEWEKLVIPQGVGLFSGGWLVQCKAMKSGAYPGGRGKGESNEVGSIPHFTGFEDHANVGIVEVEP